MFEYFSCKLVSANKELTREKLFLLVSFHEIAWTGCYQENQKP